MNTPPFVFMDLGYTYRGKYTKQQIHNEYYYEHLGRINQHMAEFNKTFEWKLSMMDRLASICGEPVKLTKWQNFLANFLMM